MCERLIVPQSLWQHTLGGLATRSQDWRESGAIWAGGLSGDDALASEVYFHHDLCNDKGRPLSMELSEDAKFQLYETLGQRGLKLVGMIHTHPEDWVELSPVDKRNQLCSRIGFWSLVVPWYARQPWQLSVMGIHARSDTGWERFNGTEIFERIILRED